MKKPLLSALAGLALLAAGAAHANPYGAYGHGQHLVGWYAQVHGTASEARLNDTVSGSVDKRADGYGFALGLQVSPTVALELQYEDLGNRTALVPSLGGATRGTFGSSAFGASAVFSQHLGQGLSLFVKPGVMETRLKVPGSAYTATRPTLGAGLEVRVSPSLSLNATHTFVRDFADTGIDARYTTVGAKFHF